MSHPVAAPLDPARRRKHKLLNLLQSVVLLGGMAGLLALCAWPLVGFGGLLWILAGAALGLALSPRVSPRLLLAMYRARPLTPANFPEGFAVLRELSRRAELARVPRFYYIPSSLLNAFYVGQGEAASIAVTDGLLRTLEPREVVAVLAHELSHIRNNDLWIMTLADTISRLTVFMSYAGIFLLVFGLPIMLLQGEPVPWLLILLLILAPTLITLLQLALSRAREYDADLDAAGLTGDPLGLASALEKLEFYQGRLWERILLPGRRLPDPSLLRSHPPTAERVKRLLELRVPGPGEGLRHGGPLDLPGHLVRVQRPPRMHLPGTWF
ncbi:MAG: zinc metalloprotease HtpX [Rhodospirillales bacterium]|nr:zinc metalloprotease HtpX [Rhodospirillales bacterium]